MDVAVGCGVTESTGWVMEFSGKERTMFRCDYRLLDFVHVTSLILTKHCSQKIT